MTLCWLLIWLISDTPNVNMWNAWAIGLLVCVIIDLLPDR